MRASAWISLAVGLVAAAALSRDASADDRTVTGRVVDEAGAPVADAEVAVAWTADAKGVRALQGSKTDADGRFSVTFPFVGEPFAAIAYDGPRKRAAAFRVERAALDQRALVTLAPTTTVEGDVLADGGTTYPAHAVVWLAPLPRSGCLVRVDPEKGRYSFPAPRGRHRLTVTAPQHAAKSAEVEVGAAEGGKPLSIGSGALEKTTGRVETGRVAPPVEGADAAPELVSMLGARHFPARWTLVYFWGDD